MGVLHVKANGNQSIELPLDENGEPIKYPDPMASIDLSTAQEKIINRSTVEVILETVKPALAVTFENPCYTGYYVGDKIVATDTYKIASMDVDLFGKAVSYLISPELMDLLAVMKDEKITVYLHDNDIVFSTTDCTLIGKVMEGIDEYAIDAISGLVDTEFDSYCKIPKSALLQLLDRLSLFIGTYDKNAVRLTFTNDGLQVESKASSGVEIIEYVDSKNFKNIKGDYYFIDILNNSLDYSYLIDDDLSKKIDMFLEFGYEEYLLKNLDILNTPHIDRLKILKILNINVNSYEELFEYLNTDSFFVNDSDISLYIDNYLTNDSCDKDISCCNLQSFRSTSRVYDFNGIYVSSIKVNRLLDEGYSLGDSIFSNMFLDKSQYYKVISAVKPLVFVKKD